MFGCARFAGRQDAEQCGTKCANNDEHMILLWRRCAEIGSRQLQEVQFWRHCEIRGTIPVGGWVCAALATKDSFILKTVLHKRGSRFGLMYGHIRRNNRKDRDRVFSRHQTSGNHDRILLSFCGGGACIFGVTVRTYPLRKKIAKIFKPSKRFPLDGEMRGLGARKSYPLLDSCHSLLKQVHVSGERDGFGLRWFMLLK